MAAVILGGVVILAPARGESGNHPHGVVCSDGGAGGHEGLPDICRLADGRLLCCFYAGYAHGSPPSEELPNGGRLMVCFSDDDGATWTQPRVIVDTETDDRDPSVTQLRDGRILLTYLSSGTPEAPRGIWILESCDGGNTWGTPRRLGEEIGWYATNAIRELSQEPGHLILPVYCMKPAANARGGMMLSHDGGRTWDAPLAIDNGGRGLDAETDVVELADGRLLAVQRGRARESTPMHASWSADRGRTWTKSEPMGFIGITPALLRVGGTVILAYGPVMEKKRWGTAIRVSGDDGRTWSEAEVVDNVKGCHPSMVQLLDGSVLVVYYDERTGPDPKQRSDIRLRRFRVKGNTVEWLPAPAATDAG